MTRRTLPIRAAALTTLLAATAGAQRPASLPQPAYTYTVPPVLSEAG